MSRNQDRIDLIKKNVTIQDYFTRVIVPSLSSYYNGYVDFGLRPVCKCPLHDEDTPSFRYYNYSNTFYCFGCGEGGDVIALHIKFMRVNFNEQVFFDDAVDYLYRTFISSKNKTKIKYKASGVREEALSTNLEVIKLNRELEKIEIMLRGKTNLDNSTLVRVYSYIDTLDKLVNMNLLNATEASDYVKELKVKIRNISL